MIPGLEFPAGPAAAAGRAGRSSAAPGRAFRTGLAAAALALLAAAPGFAADPAAAVARAEALIQDGRPASALALLRPLALRHADDTDILFFLGLAARHTALLPPEHPEAPPGEELRRALLDEAEESYRRILARRPDLAGARLELAQTLFARGVCTQPPPELWAHLLGDDCDAAEYHFRRALAGGLPEAVAQAVSLHLSLIEARKRVTGEFSFALAPDTNISNGTRARTITFTLPQFPGVVFTDTVEEERRETSGVGVVLSAAGEYRHPLDLQLIEGTRTRLSLGAGVYRRDHGADNFDDMTVYADAGPRLLFPRGEVGLLLRGERRWYGGRRTSKGHGPMLEVRYRLTDRLSAYAELERIRHQYRYSSGYNGARTSLDLNLAYQWSPTLAFGARAGWGRTDTAARSVRHRHRQAGAFGVAELPPVFGLSGIRLRLSHDRYHTAYDRLLYASLSPDPRRDRVSTTRLTVSSDRLHLFGFVPALALVREERDSNVSLFEYRRSRVELSMRQLF